MSATDLPAFILARLEEDEAVARAATRGPWVFEIVGSPAGFEDYGDVGSVVARGSTPLTSIQVADDIATDDAAFVARHDPARVLAECAAKRRIVALHHGQTIYGLDFPNTHPCDGTNGVVECGTLRALAVIWSDHSAFDSRWSL